MFAHLLSAVRRADQIIVMDLEAIVERGTYDESLALDGHYDALFRGQFEGHETATAATDRVPSLVM